MIFLIKNIFLALFRLTTKIVHCLCYWLDNIFYGSKKVSP